MRLQIGAGTRASVLECALPVRPGPLPPLWIRRPPLPIKPARCLGLYFPPRLPNLFSGLCEDRFSLTSEDRSPRRNRPARAGRSVYVLVHTLIFDIPACFQFEISNLKSAITSQKRREIFHENPTAGGSGRHVLNRDVFQMHTTAAIWATAQRPAFTERGRTRLLSESARSGLRR